jgi:hypothetical protein
METKLKQAYLEHQKSESEDCTLLKLSNAQFHYAYGESLLPLRGGFFAIPAPKGQVNEIHKSIIVPGRITPRPV